MNRNDLIRGLIVLIVVSFIISLLVVFGSYFYLNKNTVFEEKEILHNSEKKSA